MALAALAAFLTVRARGFGDVLIGVLAVEGAITRSLRDRHKRRLTRRHDLRAIDDERGIGHVCPAIDLVLRGRRIVRAVAAAGVADVLRPVAVETGGQAILQRIDEDPAVSLAIGLETARRWIFSIRRQRRWRAWDALQSQDRRRTDHCAEEAPPCAPASVHRRLLSSCAVAGEQRRCQLHNSRANRPASCDAGTNLGVVLGYFLCPLPCLPCLLFLLVGVFVSAAWSSAAGAATTGATDSGASTVGVDPGSFVSGTVRTSLRWPGITIPLLR